MLFYVKGVIPDIPFSEILPLLLLLLLLMSHFTLLEGRPRCIYNVTNARAQYCG